MALNDKDKPFEEIKKDPRTKKLTQFVTEMVQLKRKYGLNPRQVHVNALDEFMCRFNTICGLEVVQDYHVPKGQVVVL